MAKLLARAAYSPASSPCNGFRIVTAGRDAGTGARARTKRQTNHTPAIACSMPNTARMDAITDSYFAPVARSAALDRSISNNAASPLASRPRKSDRCTATRLIEPSSRISTAFQVAPVRRIT